QPPTAQDLKARVTYLDDHFQPSTVFDAELINVINEPDQGWIVIVFKPKFDDPAKTDPHPKGKIVEGEDGKLLFIPDPLFLPPGKYHVEISGLKAPRGNAMPFSFVVELVDMPAAEVPATSQPTTPA